jgi:ferredoxin
MRVHYGYSDGLGDWRITIDTDRCDGCGKCVSACPKELFITAEDESDIDNDNLIAKIKDERVKELSFHCYGYKRCLEITGSTCHEACPHDAISHSW